MKAFMLLISLLLLCLAYLLPIHYKPWAIFYGDVLTFASGLALLAAFFRAPFKIPKAQYFGFLIVLIPMIQWACGLVIDFGNALLCSSYLLMFFLMIIAAYNLANSELNREKTFSVFSLAMLVTAVISGIMAIIQWLDYAPIANLVMRFVGNRPYANFGQPNNLATFLSVGLFAGLYLYETRKASLWILIPSSLLIIFSIALTQSRTAWVVCLFSLVYWAIKQFRQNKRLTLPKMLLWVGVFAVCIAILPMLTSYVELLSKQDMVQTSSVVQRATSGYLRLDMWHQMLYAIAEQPWLGYGWNQTSVAQMTIFPLHPSHEWVTSGHNVLLDILIWNGIPLGLLIIAYMAVWLLWLNKNTKDTISIIAMLMVSAILIHAMLEFPQRYAYFLLPMGFLLGLIQAQTPNLKGITLHKNVIRGCWVISLVLLFMIWRDYKVYQENSQLLFKGQQPTVEIMGSSRILLLSQFQQRLVWIALKPTVSMSDQDLMQWSDMVKNKATPYNLKKYAQLLVYNQKMAEAEQQLFILQQLYGENIGLADIVELNHRLK